MIEQARAGGEGEWKRKGKGREGGWRQRVEKGGVTE